MHACWLAHHRRTTLGNQFPLSTFTRVPGVEPRLPGICSEHLSWLSHGASPGSNISGISKVTVNTGGHHRHNLPTVEHLLPRWSQEGGSRPQPQAVQEAFFIWEVISPGFHRQNGTTPGDDPKYRVLVAGDSHRLVLGCTHERQILAGLLLLARGSCRPLHCRQHSQHWSSVCGMPSFEPHTSYKCYFVLQQQYCSYSILHTN